MPSSACYWPPKAVQTRSQQHVGFWHESDLPRRPLFARFRGQSRHQSEGDQPLPWEPVDPEASLRLLLTSFGSRLGSLMMDQAILPAVAVVRHTLPVKAKRASMTCVQRRSAHRIRGTTLMVGTGGAVHLLPCPKRSSAILVADRHGRREEATVESLQNPASALPSGRGYHLTRRSFPSNGEAP
jgi:hypothetical protein